MTSPVVFSTETTHSDSINFNDDGAIFPKGPDDSRACLSLSRQHSSCQNTNRVRMFYLSDIQIESVRPSDLVRNQPWSKPGRPRHFGPPCVTRREQRRRVPLWNGWAPNASCGKGPGGTPLRFVVVGSAHSHISHITSSTCMFMFISLLNIGN